MPINAPFEVFFLGGGVKKGKRKLFAVTFSPASYQYTCKKSTSKVSLFKVQSGTNGRTDTTENTTLRYVTMLVATSCRAEAPFAATVKPEVWSETLMLALTASDQNVLLHDRRQAPYCHVMSGWAQ